MFAKKLSLSVDERPVPKAWLDQFFMRDFTGSGAFDETLPVGDGELEAGFAVDPGEVKARFEKWLRGRKMIAAESELIVITRPPE